jgi:hypothetical protein
MRATVRKLVILVVEQMVSGRFIEALLAKKSKSARPLQGPKIRLHPPGDLTNPSVSGSPSRIEACRAESIPLIRCHLIRGHLRREILAIPRAV